MLRIVPLLLLLLLPLLPLLFVARVPAASPPEAPMTSDAADFEAWAWKKRPVVVAGEPAAVAAQADLLEADAAGLADRDMLVVRVTGNGPAAAAVRDRFTIDSAARLTVLLIGKDTGVKRRVADPAQPVTAASLFEEVDAMPMRRREMNGG